MNRTEIENLYTKLIETIPDIQRKGKTMPYTSINGHMFSFLSKEGKIGLRLSPEDRNAIMSKYHAPLMMQHDRVMKEYVEIPDNLLDQTSTLADYLQKSLDYVSTLKPKPTKKKK